MAATIKRCPECHQETKATVNGTSNCNFCGKKITIDCANCPMSAKRIGFDSRCAKCTK